MAYVVRPKLLSAVCQGPSPLSPNLPFFSLQPHVVNCTEPLSALVLLIPQGLGTYSLGVHQASLGHTHPGHHSNSFQEFVFTRFYTLRRTSSQVWLNMGLLGILTKIQFLNPTLDQQDWSLSE
jgi:hypothetical protein